MAWQFEKLSKQAKQTKVCFVVCAMPSSLKAGVAFMHSNIRMTRMESPG